jgi:hypothetical protein
VPVLVEQLRRQEARRRELAPAVADAQQRRIRAPWREVERRVRQRLADCRSFFTGDVTQGREGFRQLTGPMLFTPADIDRYRGVRFRGTLGPSAVFGGIVVTKGTSPMPASWNQITAWLKQIDGLRAAA